jgi:hypothetical protein
MAWRVRDPGALKRVECNRCGRCCKEHLCPHLIQISETETYCPIYIARPSICRDYPVDDWEMLVACEAIPIECSWHPDKLVKLGIVRWESNLEDKASRP